MKLKRFLLFYLVLAAAIAVEIVADATLKQSVNGNFLYLFFAGMILYGLTAFPVAYLFKRTDFEIVFMVWEAFGVILGLGVAAFYFGETITVQKVLALICAFGAMIFSYF